MALERRAGAERDHRHAMLGADLDDARDLLGRVGKGHGLRQFRRVVGLAATMLLAQGRSGREAIAQ